MRVITKRVLMVMPSFPVYETGAEQQERAEGIRQLARLGYEVVVIAKVKQGADIAHIQKVAMDMGARAVLVPYRYSNRALNARERLLKFVGKFEKPLYLDGAAYEFAEPVIKKALIRELQDFKPDVVWFEYTYLWPLYRYVRRAGVPIITRSQNFEPQHFLEEDGRTMLNYLKYIPKWLSEHRSIRESKVVLAITPREEKRYKNMRAGTVATLPLRNLGQFVLLPRPVVRIRSPLHVFFMGASFNVEHNRAAARQVITEIAPEAEHRAPGAFIFHILGGKLPDDLKKQCDGTHIVYEGYVQDLDAFLQDMDIALIPSLMGAGMQQKVFEPITRGIPTITSPRAIAGYPLTAGVEYVAAHTTEEFVESLLKLKNNDERQKLASAASHKTAEIFPQKVLDAIVEKAIYDAIHG